MHTYLRGIAKNPAKLVEVICFKTFSNTGSISDICKRLLLFLQHRFLKNQHTTTHQFSNVHHSAERH